MLGKDGKKLSKRHGSVSLSQYRAEGYSRDATINFLARQGWALDGETEVFSVDEFVSNFAIGDVSKGGSIFDFEKFAWMSGEYVHAESLDELMAHCAPYMIAADYMKAEEIESRADWYRSAIALGQERVRLYSEMPYVLAFLFADDEAVPFDEKAEKNARKHENRLADLQAFSEFALPRLVEGVDIDELRAAGKAWIAERGIKFPQLFQPLRCALTGQAGGPDLYEIMALLGPGRSRARIESGLGRLGQ